MKEKAITAAICAPVYLCCCNRLTQWAVLAACHVPAAVVRVTVTDYCSSNAAATQTTDALRFAHPSALRLLAATINSFRLFLLLLLLYFNLENRLLTFAF